MSTIAPKAKKSRAKYKTNTTQLTTIKEKEQYVRNLKIKVEEMKIEENHSVESCSEKSITL